MSTGEKLKELRGGRNRDTVAAEIGISSSALGMYECDRRTPRDEIKKKIAGYYNVTVQHLFFDS